jgi:hypothetical protein
MANYARTVSWLALMPHMRLGVWCLLKKNATNRERPT